MSFFMALANFAGGEAKSFYSLAVCGLVCLFQSQSGLVLGYFIYRKLRNEYE